MQQRKSGKATKLMLKNEDVSSRVRRVDFSPADGSWISKWLQWLLDVAAPQRHIISDPAAPEPSLSLRSPITFSLFFFFSISSLSPVPEDPSLSSRFFLISLVQNTSCLHPPHVAVGTLLFFFPERCFDLAPSAGHVLYTRPGAPSQQQTVLSLFKPEWLYKWHLTSSVASMSIIHLNCSSRPSKLLTSYHLHFISAHFFCPSLHTLPFNCQCRSYKLRGGLYDSSAWGCFSTCSWINMAPAAASSRLQSFRCSRASYHYLPRYKTTLGA